MQKLQKIRKWLPHLAITLALLLPIYFAAAALGAKFGVWDWRFGFKLMTGYGPTLLKIVLGISIVALLLAIAKKPRNGVLLSIIALAIPLILMGYGQKVRTKARSIPPIHDITTDTQDPPTFTSAILDLRGENSNPVNYVGKTFGKEKKLVSDAQIKAYPEIKTIVTSTSPLAAFEKSVAAVNSLGWELQSQSQALGVVEATDTTSWFGFKDDVVIRIRPSEAGGSIIDLRSVSRVGGSDIGANAARIVEFSNKFNQ